MVHRAGEEEVASVVIRNLPHRLTVLNESLCAAGLDEVPNLHRTVTRGCGEKVTLRMELYASDPIDVALTTHDQVTVRDGPKLPSCIITSGCDDVLLGVVAEGCDSHEVALVRLRQAQVRPSTLELFTERRVIPITLRNRRRLVSLRSKGCRSSRGRLTELGGCARFLSRHAEGSRCIMARLLVQRGGIERLILGQLVHAELKILDPGLQSILLELHQHLLLHRALELVRQTLERAI